MAVSLSASVRRFLYEKNFHLFGGWHFADAVSRLHRWSFGRSVSLQDPDDAVFPLRNNCRDANELASRRDCFADHSVPALRDPSNKSSWRLAEGTCFVRCLDGSRCCLSAWPDSLRVAREVRSFAQRKN
jgi:hypothetical protein